MSKPLSPTLGFEHQGDFDSQALHHALLDLDRLPPADWMARYSASLRPALTFLADGAYPSADHEDELAEANKAADEAEAAHAALDDALRPLVRQLRVLSEWSDPETLETLTDKLLALAESVEEALNQ